MSHQFHSLESMIPLWLRSSRDQTLADQYSSGLSQPSPLASNAAQYWLE
jgi:hypothetical protein